VRLPLAVIVAVLAVAGSQYELAAQSSRWAIGAELGLSRFWGGTRSIPPNDTPAVRPYRPTTFGLRVDRALGRGRLGVGVQYAQSSLGAESEELLTAVKDAVTWWQVTPEAAWRVATLGPVAQLRVFGGPTVDLWKADGESARVRMGGQLGLEMLVPLGRRIASTLRLRSGLAGSLFDEGDLPTDVERRVMPTANLALGLRYGW
jgi:hypothetical protein